MKPDDHKDFDKLAAQWDQNPIPVRIARSVGDTIVREIAPAPDWDALDFGCGTGLVTMRLQPLVRTITGADGSQGMLDKLRDKFKELRTANGRTQLVDFEKGERVQGSYDLVVSSMTLHHVRDTEGVIRHWHELLRPNGTLAFADLDSEDGSFHSDNTGVFHFGFDRKALTTILQQTGFRDVRAVTAASVTREGEGRTAREYTVFLIIGRK